MAFQEFVFMFRTFINSFRHQMHVFGEAGLRQVLSGIDVDESPVDVFNSLIEDFNQAQRFDNDGLTDADAPGSTVPTPMPVPDVVDEEEEEEGEVPEPVVPAKPSSKKQPSTPRKPRSQGGA